MKNNVNLSIPVTFQKLESYEVKDTRFTKVKIWLMHLEENLNDSYFSKSAVEKALPTLANTPILGYIEVNDDGDKDYSDHRSVIVKDEGNFKIKYIGSAYGLIPETNNAKFESRVCDDGIEREFLTCDGLVWNKWDEPVEILNRDITKSQSMELHKDYQGVWGEDGLFHFTDFKFFGACILGDDVRPAMRSATVELDEFSVDGIWQDIQIKMDDFKTFQMQQSSNDDVDNKNLEEGGSQVEEKLELLGKYSLTDVFAVENNINLDEISLEDLETKINEHFALTSAQLSNELSMALNPSPKKDDWGYEIRDFYFVDYKDNTVYAMSRPDKWRIVSFDYSMSGDFPVVNFDSKKYCKIEYVPMEDGQESEAFSFIDEITQHAVDAKTTELEIEFAKKKDSDDDSEDVGSMMDDEMQSMMDNMVSDMNKHMDSTKKSLKKKMKSKGMMTANVDSEALQSKISTLEIENEELKKFQTEKLAEDRVKAENDLVERFASELTAEEITAVMEKASEYTIEELEVQLYASVGRSKAKFTAPKQEKNGVKVTLDNGSGVEVKNEPAWMNLVRKYSVNK